MVTVPQMIGLVTDSGAHLPDGITGVVPVEVVPLTVTIDDVDYLDGITCDMGDWWFNVRKSNTEPLLRLNLEASSPTQLSEKLNELQGVLGEPHHGH